MQEDGVAQAHRGVACDKLDSATHALSLRRGKAQVWCSKHELPKGTRSPEVQQLRSLGWGTCTALKPQNQTIHPRSNGPSSSPHSAPLCRHLVASPPAPGSPPTPVGRAFETASEEVASLKSILNFPCRCGSLSTISPFLSCGGGNQGLHLWTSS